MAPSLIGGSVGSSNPEPKLGLFSATAIGVGTIVGAGIYVVIGIAAGLAGPAVVLSIIIAASVSFLTALSFAELAAWMPREGGVYEFAHELLTPYLGFITGWMWMLSNIFTGAAVSLGFASYFVELIPGFSPAILAAVICLVFTLLNYVGIQHTASINNILVVAKLSILGFFVALGFFFVHPGNFTPFYNSAGGVLYASVFIFFAFGGFARVAVVAEEVKDPEKTIPKAIILSLAISSVVYILVGLVAVGIVGAPALGDSGSPLAKAMQGTGSSGSVYLISVGGLLATASVLLTSVLGVSRVAYSMARRNELPRLLAIKHSKFGTPHYAVLTSGIIMALLVLLTDLKNVVAVGTITMLFYYGVANAAALRLRKRARIYPRVIPILGISSCVTLLAFAVPASPQGWIASLIGFVVGTAYYVLGTRAPEK